MKIEDFKIIEDNYEIIKSEYLKVEKELVEWPQTDLHGGGWKVFPIFSLGGVLRWETNRSPICRDSNIAKRVEGFSEKTPKTADLIEKNVRNLGSVGFSRLPAGEKIKPHLGYQGDFLRYHMGIDVPDGDCGLECNGKTYRWENGKSFIFDDRLEHRAWNNTEKDRIILIIDFIPETQLMMKGLRKKLKS